MPTEIEVTKEQLDVWKHRLARAVKAREPQMLSWRKIRQYYKGKYFAGHEERDRVAANWMLAVVRQMGATLYYQNPTMYFTPRSVLGEIAAPIMEGITRYERQVIDAELQERRCLNQALLYSESYLKHGYNFEFGMDPAWADPKMTKNRMEQLYGAGNSEFDMPQGMLTEYNTGVRSDHTWTRAIPPWNMLVDSEAVTYEEARWVAHRFYRPWVECVRDERYNLKARKELQPTGRSEFFDDEWVVDRNHDNYNSPYNDAAMVSLYEIFDRTTMTVITASFTTDEPLMAVRFPFFGKHGPYERLQFYEADDEFWGINYADSFSNQIEILNKLRTQMMNHLQKWGVTRGAYATGALSKEDAKRFFDGRDAIYALNVSGTDDINKIVTMFPHVPIDADAWRLQDLAKSDLYTISGLPELNVEGQQSQSTTATATSYIQQHSSIRTADMRFPLDRFLRNSTRKLVGLLRQFWPASRVVPIVGDDGRIWDTLTVTRDIVQAEYEVDIEPGSTERIDRNIRIRQTIDSIRELAPIDPLLKQMGWQLNWPEIVKVYLKNTEIFRNPEKALIPLPPPQAQPMGGQPTPEQGGQMGGQANVVPFPGAVNNMGQMPQETEAGAQGRMMSEMMGSGGQR